MLPEKKKQTAIQTALGRLIEISNMMKIPNDLQFTLFLKTGRVPLCLGKCGGVEG